MKNNDATVFVSQNFRFTKFSFYKIVKMKNALILYSILFQLCLEAKTILDDVNTNLLPAVFIAFAKNILTV